jgi:hypothetical protein
MPLLISSSKTFDDRSRVSWPTALLLVLYNVSMFFNTV